MSKRLKLSHSQGQATLHGFFRAKPKASTDHAETDDTDTVSVTTATPASPGTSNAPVTDIGSSDGVHCDMSSTTYSPTVDNNTDNRGMIDTDTVSVIQPKAQGE